MRLKHQHACQPAHPVDIGESPELPCRPAHSPKVNLVCHLDALQSSFFSWSAFFPLNTQPTCPPRANSALCPPSACGLLSVSAAASTPPGKATAAAPLPQRSP